MALATRYLPLVSGLPSATRPRGLSLAWLPAVSGLSPVAPGPGGDVDPFEGLASALVAGMPDPFSVDPSRASFSAD